MIKDKIDKIIEAFKTIKRERIPNSNFVKVENYTCYLNNNRIIQRTKLSKGDTDGSAAIVLPLTTDNKVIVVVEPRVFTDTTVSVDVPAGYREKETGYTTNDIKFLGKFYQDHGISAACNHYYLALNCKKKSKQKLDEEECVKQLEITIEELFYLLDNGYIKSLNTAYLIEKCRPYLERINK